MTLRIRVGLFVVGFLLLYGRFAPVRIVRVVGRSMEPAYHNGQWLLATTDTRDVQPDDVVVVRQGGKRLVKRVASTGGDRIFLVRSDDLWLPAHLVGGEAKTLAFWRRCHRETRWLTVPPNTVFVMGDNLINSVDSRTFGALPRSTIEAVVVTRR